MDDITEEDLATVAALKASVDAEVDAIDQSITSDYDLWDDVREMYHETDLYNERDECIAQIFVEKASEEEGLRISYIDSSIEPDKMRPHSFKKWLEKHNYTTKR